MTAALVGALEGLDTVLCEKTGMVGGTTSTSGGTIWIPGSSQSVKAGVPDTIEAARRYLGAVMGTRPGEAQRDAFLEAGPKALDYLEARSEVTFIAALAHPDYIGNQPDAAYGGRALGPTPFDGRKLGQDFDRVRPPRPEFMVLGGMMVVKADIPPPAGRVASAKSFLHVGAPMVTRYGPHRLRFKRGTHLLMGNALVARLLFTRFWQRDVPICSTPASPTWSCTTGQGRSAPSSTAPKGAGPSPRAAAWCWPPAASLESRSCASGCFRQRRGATRWRRRATARHRHGAAGRRGARRQARQPYGLWMPLAPPPARRHDRRLSAHPARSLQAGPDRRQQRRPPLRQRIDSYHDCSSRPCSPRSTGPSVPAS